MHCQHLVICISAAEPANITEWEGSLTSPNYPLTYPASSSLTWIKSVSPGNRVKDNHNRISEQNATQTT
ncbi:hypothetical protein OS493_021748 [Desmophyllum pertusum]|uniref:Uncharacterized protein n=1 Tax=Desmophyllum pertusum TaxID=174260 RepID=A0A9X0A0G6_9CNID|nr:hypothetical protein OS493_021748 [Desmophyllum pertusum]